MDVGVFNKLSQMGKSNICPIAIFVNDGCILCGLRHYSKEEWKEVSVWTWPGGRCDENETIEIALRREVLEEIGISEFDVLNYLGDVPGAKEGDIVPIFVCQTSQSPKLMEPEKFLEWKWHSFSNFPENLINLRVKEVVYNFLK